MPPKRCCRGGGGCEGCFYRPKLLQRCCLLPHYSLKRQLIAGYGITAFVTIVVVVLLATIAARRAATETKRESIDLFKTQLDAILQESGILTGDILDKKINGLRGSASLLAEIVRDRIVGYPNDGWENDTHVPFWDTDTQRNVYPLHVGLLPRDWMVKSNLDFNNTESLGEHVQERASGPDFLPYMEGWNTETAMFLFQGNCDPNQTAPTQKGYYPFCREENNNAQLGGILNPTTTLAPLEQKAADLSVFVRAIFEAEPAVLLVAVIFANSGAGASLIYPGQSFSYQAQYLSAGCEWMRQINNVTGRPYATDEEINRCTPNGTRASAREYNGMERPWCSDQALHPGEARIYGPYADATRDSWRLTVGKAVFDRRTGEFIACIAMDLSLVQANNILAEVNEDVPSEMVVTKPDGTVVVGPFSNDTTSNLTPHLWETGFIDLETYQELTDDLAFWEGEWDIESARRRYDYSVKSNGNYYTVFPSPIPPDEYDPDYKPEFFIFGAIKSEVQDNVIAAIEESIENDVERLILVMIAIGAIGLCCLLAVVSIVAQVLTRPLKWMESKAWEIVNHTDKRVGNSLAVASEAVGDNNEDSNNHAFQFFSFIPKTEVQELVSEFRSMISGFSGEGASRVAVPRHTETKNVVSWMDEFREVYQLSPSVETKLREESRVVSRSVSRRMSNQGRDRSLSLKMDTAEFARIVAAEFDSDEENESNPFFRSAQMSGECTTEGFTDPSFQQTRVSLASAKQTVNTIHRELLAKDNVSSRFAPSTRINLGSNVRHTNRRSRLSSSSVSYLEEWDDPDIGNHDTNMWRSPLFWNLLFWIVLPLLVSIIAIMIIVGINLLKTFPKWTDEAKKTSFELEEEHLESSVNLVVKHIEQIFVEPLFDLHIITRMAGWLLFGAVNRSNSFTDVEMGMVDECKAYVNIDECPFHKDDTRSPCACEWEDPWNKTCQDRDDNRWGSVSDPRYVQRLWYVNQVRTANESYPQVHNSPETTFWYTDESQMQDADKGSNAKGHSTAYDRLRVASALSTAIFPVYNYRSDLRADGSPTSAFSGYISFEADGELYGYSGCNYDAANYAHFQSSEATEAYLIRPDLCPKGKYGYDPRCRPWYNTAKQRGLNKDDAVYITPPYQFATVDTILNTAVSPLIDPQTGEFVGNTLTDFSISDIAKVFEESYIQFYAVIMPNVAGDQNVVASSELMSNSTPVPIFDLFMQHDPPDSANAAHFASIILDMENEGTGQNCDLNRTNATGFVQQYCYYYEPIYNRELRPVQPDDYSRGAEVIDEFLYSIVMFQEIDAFFSTFEQGSDAITRALRRNAVVYMWMTALITLICIAVTAMISLSVTRPMIQLLRTVKQVNSGGIEDDMPPLTEGSREVHQVYTSFAKLYKIVRMSNSAFFFGDLKLAHHIALDALRLFRKIGDEKAIAIANNNMGNTLLAWIVECRETGKCLKIEDDDGGICCAMAAINHYTDSVASGKKDFERAIGDAEKCQFAQQLADRHFNRAMCLLYTSNDPCSPRDAKESALDDLFLARQYDQGVREYMLHSKTLLNNSDVVFGRSLRRLHGLAALLEIDPDVWNVWDIYDLVDQADLMLQAAWDQDEAPIFRNVKKTGRLQELEGAVTGIELSSGKGNDAVLLATRMLVEDEFLLDSAFIQAADCFLQFSRESDNSNFDSGDEDTADAMDKSKDYPSLRPRGLSWSGTPMIKLRQELKRMRKQGMRNALDIGRSFVFCIELNSDWNGRSVLTKLQDACLTFYDENCQAGDSVGIVSFLPQTGNLHRLEPSQREDSEEEQRRILVDATTGVACSKFVSALDGAIDMALELEASTANDVCLLYVSDGGAYDAVVHRDIQQKLERYRASLSESLPHANSPSLPSSSFSSSSIDLVIIGLDVEYNHTRPLPFVESCKSLALATRSRTSNYLEADPRNINDAFKQAAAAINSGTSFAGIRLQQALTMQRF